MWEFHGLDTDRAVFCDLFTHSRSGQPLFLFGHGEGPVDLLLIGGVHGNEPEGVILCEALMAKLLNSSLCWRALPRFNPDGLVSDKRTNAKGVDLNRNLPTKDWSPEAFNKKYPPGDRANSEPENQALVSFFEKNEPKLVVSFHSFEKFMLNINGECREVAEVISAVNQYPIEESIGYPTPGCLGTYAGLERKSPTITYEVERGLSTERILSEQLPAILKGIEHFESQLKKRK